MSLLVVGSIALDSVKTPFGKVDEALGGSAVYFSCASAFFNPARLVGVVGADFPKKYIGPLHRRGVDLEGLKIDGGKTFRWKGEYGFDLNTAHTIYTHLNVFAEFKPEIPEEYRDSDNVFLANIDPSLQMDVLRQIDDPRLIACDTMNYWIENKPRELKKLLKNVHIFFANDKEAREFSGELNLLKAARYIFSCGPKIAIIKKGEHGVLCVSKDFIFSYPTRNSYPPGLTQGESRKAAWHRNTEGAFPDQLLLQGRSNQVVIGFPSGDVAIEPVVNRFDRLLERLPILRLQFNHRHA